MVKAKKVVKPEETLEGLGDFKDFIKKAEEPKQPTITSVTIAHTGTIFGLADNKIYVYDDIKHTWRAL